MLVAPAACFRASLLVVAPCVTWLLAAALPAPALAQQDAARAGAPTFDCRLARKPSELRICMVPDLARLDVALAQAYDSRQAAAVGADAGHLRLTQRDFLRRRDFCQADEACLRAVMQGRLAQLQPSPAAPAVAPTGIPPSGDLVTPVPGPGAQPPPSGDARRQARIEQLRERQAEILQRREQRLAATPAGRAPLTVQQALTQRIGDQDTDRPPPPDATPAGDEWRGVYGCGGEDFFMRLVLPQPPAQDNTVRAVIEFGPGPAGAGPRGSFSATGTFPSGPGSIHLEPDAWIHRPPTTGEVATFGLQGERQPDGRVAGTLLGPPECKAFRAWHVVRGAMPENPDGLLLRVPVSNAIPLTLSLEDCRRYGAWLASGHDLRIAAFSVSSLFYDVAGQQRVLGRTVDAWHTDDYRRMNNIAGYCRDQLAHSAALGDADLVRRIQTYLPRPFDEAPQNWLSADWGRAELAALLREEAQGRAADRLAHLATLPPIPASLTAIDQEIASRGNAPELRYLEDSDRVAYQKQVAAQRPVLGQAIVTAMLRDFDQMPRTPDSLRAMKDQAQQLADALRHANEPAAAALAEHGYSTAAASVAAAIWPGFLDAALATLRTLEGADYRRFPEIRALRDREALLRGAAPPPDAERDRAYQAALAAATAAMVERSMPRLLAWVAALPPSDAANRKLAAFTQDTFGAGGVPNQFAELRSAIAAKLAAYNPDHYRRPDIVMSLIRQLWPEVATEGLEDIAYFATALRRLDDHCPGTIPPPGSAASDALTRYVLDASFRITQRIMSGKVQNRAEAQRFVLLALNGVFNRPGCRVDVFGTVTSCTTPEEQSQVNEALLTSSDAVADMQVLAARGCRSEPVTAYVASSLQLPERGRQGGRLDLPDAVAAASRTD